MFPFAWKERQLLGVVITDAALEKSCWEWAQVLVASTSLLWVGTHELGSSKFGFQVDSKLAVVPDKVQGQHKVHLPGAFSLPAVMTQLCAPSPQQLAQGCCQTEVAQVARWSQQEEVPTLSGNQRMNSRKNLPLRRLGVRAEPWLWLLLLGPATVTVQDNGCFRAFPVICLPQFCHAVVFWRAFRKPLMCGYGKELVWTVVSSLQWLLSPSLGKHPCACSALQVVGIDFFFFFTLVLVLPAARLW